MHGEFGDKVLNYGVKRLALPICVLAFYSSCTTSEITPILYKVLDGMKYNIITKIITVTTYLLATTGHQ